MLIRCIKNDLSLHLFVLSCAFSISALWAAPKEAPAQERLNFAYISPNASSSSVLWVAKEMGIFKKHGLDVNVIYIKSAVPDLPYPTLEGMKTLTAEMGRTRPEVLKADPASFIDASFVKAIEEEGFMKRLGQRTP